jgi:hypothetical protein
VSEVVQPHPRVQSDRLREPPERGAEIVGVDRTAVAAIADQADQLVVLEPATLERERPSRLVLRWALRSSRTGPGSMTFRLAASVFGGIIRRSRPPRPLRTRWRLRSIVKVPLRSSIRSHVIASSLGRRQPVATRSVSGTPYPTLRPQRASGTRARHLA